MPDAETTKVDVAGLKMPWLPADSTFQVAISGPSDIGNGKEGGGVDALAVKLADGSGAGAANFSHAVPL